MWSCDQKENLWEKLSYLQFYKYLTRKTHFFEGWPWFKFSNLELVLVIAFAFYSSVTKGLKLKVRKFLGLTPTFGEVAGRKLIEEGGFLLEVFCKKGVPKNFAKFSVKHLCRSLTFSKVAGCRHANVIKRGSEEDVFCGFWKIFMKTFLMKHLAITASVFCSSQEYLVFCFIKTEC